MPSVSRWRVLFLSDRSDKPGVLQSLRCCTITGPCRLDLMPYRSGYQTTSTCTCHRSIYPGTSIPGATTGNVKHDPIYTLTYHIPCPSPTHSHFHITSFAIPRDVSTSFIMSIKSPWLRTVIPDSLTIHRSILIRRTARSCSRVAPHMCQGCPTKIHPELAPEAHASVDLWLKSHQISQSVFAVECPSKFHEKSQSHKPGHQGLMNRLYNPRDSKR